MQGERVPNPRSAHLVDPELRDALTSTAPLDMAALATRRQRFEDTTRALAIRSATATDVARTEVRVKSPPPSPDVRVLVYRPELDARPLPAVLWIHGGGFVMGSAESTDSLARAMAREVGCVVVSVDYRLAPEAPAPAASEDCYVALAWMHSEAAALGIDANRIAVGGASAGGGLAAGVALAARDRGIPLVYQALVYPMLDERTGTEPNPASFTGEYAWTSDDNVAAWRAYLGVEPGSGSVSPYISAAHADDLSGLPATFLAVGALDLFVHENLEYARRLITAGVPTELHVYPGAYHGFVRVPSAEVSQTHHRLLMRAVQRGVSSCISSSAKSREADTT